jgi:nascent polypeptide-associated complex subunit alpha
MHGGFVMFPGMRGMNPKQMQAMMRKMGIRLEEIDASEVIIKTKTGKIVIKEPSVQAMIVKGDKTYQISGREVSEGEDEVTEEVVKKAPVKKPKKKGPAYTDEDVRLVMEQTGCSEEVARKTLEESDGQPAEAILKLMG